MIDGLYQVTTNYLCAGFVVANGKVIACAPILRKKLEYWFTIAQLIKPEDDMFFYRVVSKKEIVEYYTFEDALDYVKAEHLDTLVGISKGNDTGTCWTRYYKIVKAANGYGIMEYQK